VDKTSCTYEQKKNYISLSLSHTHTFLLNSMACHLSFSHTNIHLSPTHAHTHFFCNLHTQLCFSLTFFILLNHIRISHTFLCNQITHTHLCISHTRFIKFNHTRPLSHASTRTLLSNSITHAPSLSLFLTHTPMSSQVSFQVALSNSPEWMNYCLQRTRERRREKNDFCKKKKKSLSRRLVERELLSHSSHLKNKILLSIKGSVTLLCLTWDVFRQK